MNFQRAGKRRSSDVTNRSATFSQDRAVELSDAWAWRLYDRHLMWLILFVLITFQQELHQQLQQTDYWLTASFACVNL